VRDGFHFYFGTARCTGKGRDIAACPEVEIVALLPLDKGIGQLRVAGRAVEVKGKPLHEAWARAERLRRDLLHEGRPRRPRVRGVPHRGRESPPHAARHHERGRVANRLVQVDDTLYQLFLVRLGGDLSPENQSTEWVNPHLVGIAQPRRAMEFKTVRRVCRRRLMNRDTPALLPSAGLFLNFWAGCRVQRSWQVRCLRPLERMSHCASV